MMLSCILQTVHPCGLRNHTSRLNRALCSVAAKKKLGRVPFLYAERVSRGRFRSHGYAALLMATMYAPEPGYPGAGGGRSISGHRLVEQYLCEQGGFRKDRTESEWLMAMLGDGSGQASDDLKMHEVILAAWHLTFDSAVVRAIHALKPGDWKAVPTMWAKAKAGVLRWLQQTPAQWVDWVTHSRTGHDVFGEAVKVHLRLLCSPQHAAGTVVAANEVCNIAGEGSTQR